MFVLLSFSSKYLTLPYGDSPGEIVSAISRSGFGTWTNQVRFLLTYAGTLFAFLRAYRRGASLLGPANSILTRFSVASGADIGRLALWFTLLVVLGVLTLNWTATDVTTPLDDTFHEGEYVGYAPAIQAGSSFHGTFLIHGGMDLLPGWFANHFSSGDRRLAPMRLITVALHVFAFLAAPWVIYMAAKPQIPGRLRIEAAFLVLASFMAVSSLLQYNAHSLVPAIVGREQPLSVRDAVFLVQLAVLFGFLHSAREGRRAVVLFAYCVVMGALLPLSFLYCYDRAIYMAATVVLMTLAVFSLPKRAWTPWAAGLALGVLVGVAGLLLVVGPAGARGLLEQIAYLMKTSRFVWTIPLSLRSLPPEIFVLLGLAVLLQCGAIAFLLGEWRRVRNLRSAMDRHLWILGWLVVSMIFLRTALERSDRVHVLWGVIPSFLFLGAVIVIWLDGALDRAGLLPRGSADKAGGWVVWCLVGSLLLWPSGSPFKALRTIRDYVKNADTLDTRIVKEDYAAAAAAVKPEVPSSGCFFTMTNEGIWYYVLGVPSCSRFHHLVYARDAEAQQEVVESLAARKPPVILFSNSFWSNAIDDVTFFNSNATVARYVLRVYEPHLKVGGHWFWRYSDEEKSFQSRPVGTVDSIPAKVERAHDAAFSGSLFSSAAEDAVEAVFTSVGSDNTLVWAGNGEGEKQSAMSWKATLPTGALPAGPATVRFWALRRSGRGLDPLGAEVRIVVQ